MDARIPAITVLVTLAFLAGCSGGKDTPNLPAFDEAEPFIEGTSLPEDAGISVVDEVVNGPAFVVIHGSKDDVRVDVEVADKEEERAKGYSNRDPPSPGTGMLFVFDEVAPVSFHMKDVSFLLDIIFLDEAGTVVNLATMTPCKSNPCPLWQSREPVKYAVELPVGFIKENRISRGTKVDLDYEP